MAKNAVSKSCEGSKYAIVWYDEGTGWREAAPNANRNISAARKAFRQLAGPRARIDSFYSDNAGELTEAADELDWVNPISTPQHSKTNGRAERQVQHAEHSTKVGINRSGMPVGTWDHAIQHGCMSGNSALID